MGTHSVDRPICRIYGYGSSVYAYTIRYSQLYVLIGSCLATYAYDFVAPRSYLISDTDTCMLYGRVTVRTPLASVDTYICVRYYTARWGARTYARYAHCGRIGDKRS